MGKERNQEKKQGWISPEYRIPGFKPTYFIRTPDHYAVRHLLILKSIYEHRKKKTYGELTKP